jgi:hypothetical protein
MFLIAQQGVLMTQLVFGAGFERGGCRTAPVVISLILAAPQSHIHALRCVSRRCMVNSFPLFARNPVFVHSINLQ